MDTEVLRPLDRAIPVHAAEMFKAIEHTLGTLTHHPLGRQEASEAECDHPPAQAHPPRGTGTTGEKIKLPERPKPRGYQEPDYPFKFVPELTLGPSG